MAKQFLSDSHMHSSASFDGFSPVEEMARAAWEHGMDSITITDHRDCSTFLFDNSRAMMECSRFMVKQAAADWEGKLEVLFGVELGEPLQDLHAAEEVERAGPYDFILGSLHNLKGEEDFYFLHYEKEDSEELLSRYFSELLQMVQWGRFDSLAHLTYPFRYMRHVAPEKTEITRFLPQIDLIFEDIIRRGIALEVNASGYRQEIGVPLPDESLVRRYYEKGGRMITIGADAHIPRDTGAGIPRVLEMLRRIGFSHYTLFRKREPVRIPIL